MQENNNHQPDIGKRSLYLDLPLQRYLDDLASAKSTPGGGSASALSGALGAGLASMVVRLTLKVTEKEEVLQELEGLLQQTEKLRLRFEELIQEDIEVYERLSAAFKMPRGTNEERTARVAAMQAQLIDAALVPLGITEHAAELVQCCQRIAEIGNINVLSDVGTAAMLASSAGAGAAWIVRTNVRVMKDLEKVSILSDRLSAALERISACSQEITGIIGRRE